MSQLSISAIALAEPGGSLINVVVSVCDAEGEPVRSLTADAFSHDQIHASSAAGDWKLDKLAIEAFEEFANGRYRLALYCATKLIRAKGLSISVQRMARRNPPGLLPASYDMVAQGHTIIPIHETD